MAINNSRTEHIIKVGSASNTGLPGVLVFKISDENIFIRNLNFTIDDDDDDDDDELFATFSGNSYSLLKSIYNVHVHFQSFNHKG